MNSLGPTRWRARKCPPDSRRPPVRAARRSRPLLALWGPVLAALRLFVPDREAPGFGEEIAALLQADCRDRCAAACAFSVSAATQLCGAARISAVQRGRERVVGWHIAAKTPRLPSAAADDPRESSQGIVVEAKGVEPSTFALRTRRSTN